MARTYAVVSEGAGILNPGERPFRSLDRARALALEAATECSWQCLTPPAPDNEVRTGRGNFRCGASAAHGIHIEIHENGRILPGQEGVPEEKFQRCRSAGKNVDWTLEAVVDRGTDYLDDGSDTFYFTGPELTDTGWDQVLKDIADGDEVLEATVRPTPFGRYAHLTGPDGDYPMKLNLGRNF
jgi:hypothetical protein